MPPLAEPIVGLFTEEWDRFKQGVANLHPDAQAEASRQLELRYSRDERNTLYIPGVLDPKTRRPGAVPIAFPGGLIPIAGEIHFKPKPNVSAVEKREYYAAKRERRAPVLTPESLAEIERRREQVRRIATGPDAAQARSWGAIMTSLDNVQDFFSTLATFGRLAVWFAPRVLGRFVPVIGPIVLISDVLNMLGLMGMLATPLYALLCNGPRAALAAGIPVALFKQGLKNEVWKIASLNPFLRSGKYVNLPIPPALRGIQTAGTLAARRLARAQAVGRLPSLGNLLEVAQTTDQLWGVGVSFGATIGFVNSAAQAATLAATGGDIKVQPNPLSDALVRRVNQPFRDDHPLDTLQLYRAANLLTAAPVLLARAGQLDDEVVIKTLIGVHQALAMHRHRLRAYDVSDILALAWDREWSPPPIQDVLLREEMAERRLSEYDVNRWALEDAPRTITPTDYARWTLEHTVPAVQKWLLRHRNDELGWVGGAVVSEATEFAFLLATGDPQALRWALTTDARLLASLAEESLLPLVNAPPERLWAFWTAARRRLEATEATSLQRGELLELLQRFDVPYIAGKPPDAPWPKELQEWAAKRGSTIG